LVLLPENPQHANLWPKGENLKRELIAPKALML